MDKITAQKRSENMRKIRSQNTAPEVAVRSLLHRLGYRYRLHSTALPGKPDIVMSRLRTVIFVHGCFWHQHTKCSDGHIPKNRQVYWIPKLARNQQRDKAHRISLKKLGWKVLTVWECELRHPTRLQTRLTREIQKQESRSAAT